MLSATGFCQESPVSRCSRLPMKHSNVHDAYAKAGERLTLPAGCAMRFMKGGRLVPAVTPTLDSRFGSTRKSGAQRVVLMSGLIRI
jgi:hypothetical protein